MTVAEALTVQAALQKLDTQEFVPSIPWWEPTGINECIVEFTNNEPLFKRMHIATNGRCEFCGHGPSEHATFEPGITL